MEVRLHNCDCMAFMADIPDQYYDLAVVDPPYYPDARTIIVPGGDISTTGIRRRKYAMPHWETPTESYFLELFRVSKAQIIWGINYFPICPGSGRIVWDKCCDNGTQFSDCEITMRDLDLIEEALVNALSGVYHDRIRYPKERARRNAFAGEKKEEKKENQ